MDEPIPLRAVERLVGAHAALRAAADTGVLARLAEQAATPAAVAADLGLDARLVAALLPALRAAGVVTATDGGGYRASPHATAVLDRVEAFYGGLADALRGRADGAGVDTVRGAGAFYPEVVGLLATSLASAADAVARQLASPCLRVLDAGAGGAPWSLAMVRHEPSCHVAAVDLPDVVAVTRDAVEAAGVADRYELIAGDLFALRPEPVHDVVLAGNLCHLFAPERAAALLARLATALAPGGRLAVIDQPADRPAADGLGTATYALGLALRTEQGRLHSTADYHGWLAAAGLGQLDAQPVGAHGLCLLTGRRPAAAASAASMDATSLHNP